MLLGGFMINSLIVIVLSIEIVKLVTNKLKNVTFGLAIVLELSNYNNDK